MFLAFGTFIIACGFTHFMEVVVLWKPLYWLSGDVKLITAVASVITAVALPPLVPKVHQMISAAKLSDERKTRVEHAYDELFRSNKSLEQEMTKRNSAEGELRRLSGRLLELQDEERRRLARELHDSTGQLLAAIQLNLSLVTQVAGADNGEVQRRLSDTAQLTSQAITEVRTMSYLLHPPMLDEAGLALALQWYVEGFVERSNLRIDVQLPSHLDRLPRELEVAIFRILQESLTNIHRHSGSPSAEIKLIQTAQEVVLMVRDFGKGILSSPQADNNGGRNLSKLGVGIRGMQERVHQLGGTLSITRQNPGTMLEAHFPLPKPEKANGNVELAGPASLG
jgi:signal transduction histidine kinase